MTMTNKDRVFLAKLGLSRKVRDKLEKMTRKEREKYIQKQADKLSYQQMKTFKTSDFGKTINKAEQDRQIKESGKKLKDLQKSADDIKKRTKVDLGNMPKPATKDALRSRGNTSLRGGGGGGGGLSFKHYLEGNLPGRKKYKSGGIVKKKLDGIAKRGKTKGRMI